MSSSRKYFYPALALALALVLLDRVFKFIFLKTPSISSGVFVNENFVFGLGLNNTVSFIIGLIFLVVFLGYAFRKNKPAPGWLVLGGALSNLADRIYYGGVIDYLPIFWGGIINLADIMIFSGVMILFLARGKRYVD